MQFMIDIAKSIWNSEYFKLGLNVPQTDRSSASQYGSKVEKRLFFTLEYKRLYDVMVCWFSSSSCAVNLQSFFENYMYIKPKIIFDIDYLTNVQNTQQQNIRNTQNSNYVQNNISKVGVTFSVMIQQYRLQSLIDINEYHSLLNILIMIGK